MNDPAIIAALISVVAVVTLALATLVYRFGRLCAQVDHLRRDASRRHDESRRESRERYEGLVSRLARLETYFMTGSSGAGNDD
jgi:hypothetical protein